MNNNQSLPPSLVTVAIATIALLLHILDLGVFLSGDEADFWLPRSGQFLAAITSGDWAGTAISTHPGVTTMWLGAAGIQLRRWLFESGILQQETFPLLLALHRLPAALVHTAGITVGYSLLRRLASPTVAALAALLWATDPFVLAFNRVLHVDGLATTFATLALLAALIAWHHDPRTRWFVVSGVCGGLAILSKSPALLIIPTIGSIALLVWATRPTRTVQTLKREALRLLLWGGVCGLTMIVVFPAVWADPLRVYNLFRIGIEVEGGSPHMLGNFFLGQHVDEPGILFYPVALALRTTPITLAGLLLLPWAMGKIGQQRSQAPAPPAPAPPAPAPIRGDGGNIHHSLTPRDLAILAGWIILFTAAMSVFPKKFNRYLVPVFPALDILAAFALAYAANRLTRLPTRFWRLAGRGVLVGIAAATVINAAWYHPYGIAYFNQLLGGPQAGADTFVVGWGEGYEQVADYLNRQPDSTGVVTVSRWGSSLNAYLHKGIQANSADNGKLPDAAGYVIVYIRHVLGGISPTPPYDQFYRHEIPLHTVQIHGVDYAWIYAVPPPIAHPLPAQFGKSLAVRGYGLNTDTTTLRKSGMITITMQWQKQTAMNDDVLLFLHVLNERGERVAQVDIPPGGADSPTSAWEIGRIFNRSYPLAVGADLPPGRYRIALGLYHPTDFARLTLDAPPTAQGSGAGPNALFLEPFMVYR